MDIAPLIYTFLSPKWRHIYNAAPYLFIMKVLNISTLHIFYTMTFMANDFHGVFVILKSFESLLCYSEWKGKQFILFRWNERLMYVLGIAREITRSSLMRFYEFAINAS